jgi:hypothetical protein
MPTPIRPASSQASSATVSTRPLKVKAAGNDPAQKVTASSAGVVTVSGTANNRGIARSVLTFEFDGKRVSIDPDAGDTAKKVLEKLQQALPKGYQAERVSGSGASVSFRVLKEGAPRSNVAAINDAFQRAQRDGSVAGNKVGVNELRAAVKAAEAGGFSAADKLALAQNWAGLFTGAEYRATPAAQREFAKLQERLELPRVPVR